ncbi:MAG: S41 family peptidase [Candidatus Eisenbacteria bacterium]
MTSRRLLLSVLLFLVLLLLIPAPRAAAFPPLSTSVSTDHRPEPFTLDGPPSRFDPSNRDLLQPIQGIEARRRGDFRRVDWAAVIDSTWGESPMTPAERIALFESFWSEVDRRFACFEGIDVDWQALHDRYLPEIAGDVSRGRFAAILNHLSLALQESHTMAFDSELNQSTPLLPGVPLLLTGTYGENGHFGAGLTPLPDSSLLVYSAVPDHPLGLVPGDLVLGYDGIPWGRIYPQLVEAQLPIAYGRSGSSPSAIRHCWMMSAGMNWHLFDTIDVVKYATNDTLHLSVDPLIGRQMSLFCSEQLDVPGVSKPDLETNDTVSWGIVEGTDVGYIYLYKLRYDFEQQFYNAVDSLMTFYDTSGLILDFRLNYGGTLDFYLPAFERLFYEDVYTIAFGARCSPEDHEPICPASAYGPERMRIHGDPDRGYRKPIAVLTGPGAVSAGDVGPYMLTFHPKVRVFGRPSCSAFNLPFSTDPPPPAPWYMRYARYEGYPVGEISHHLTHDEFPIDEEVWLTRDDAARGVDTVVEAALGWIRASSGAEEEQAAARPIARILPARPNPFSGETTLRYFLDSAAPVELAIYSVSGRLVRRIESRAYAPAGEHVAFWDGRDDRGRRVGSGVYLARLEAGGRGAERRLVLTR